MDLLHLAQAVRRAPEDPGVTSIHEREAPAFPAREPGERPNQRRVPDRHPVRHAPRQLHRLEQPIWLAGEHGEPVGAIARKLVLQETGGALERRLEGHLVLVREPVDLTEAAFRLVEQRAHGRLARGRGGELRRVQVQIQAEDDWAV